MADPVTASAATFGLTGLSTALNIQAAQKAHKLERSKNRLDLARTKREQAEGLARNLATRTAVASARGAAPNAGSLMREAIAASRQARRNVRHGQANIAHRNQKSSLATRNAITGSLLDFAGKAVGFGGQIGGSFGGAGNGSTPRLSAGDPNGLPPSF